MRKIAVTGNMGSGKSTVCKVFETLGVPVFYADQEAKKLYAQPEIKSTLENKFGPHIYFPNNTLNRKALASIIFNDDDALNFINNLIHPRVYQMFNQWVLKHEKEPYCIQESALVFETGNYKQFFKTILVYAPDDMLISRIIKRDNSTKTQAIERLSKQKPQKDKIKLASCIINNDNSTLIIPQIINLHKEFSLV